MPFYVWPKDKLLKCWCFLNWPRAYVSGAPLYWSRLSRRRQVARALSSAALRRRRSLENQSQWTHLHSRSGRRRSGSREQLAKQSALHAAGPRAAAASGKHARAGARRSAYPRGTRRASANCSWCAVLSCELPITKEAHVNHFYWSKCLYCTRTSVIVSTVRV